MKTYTYRWVYLPTGENGIHHTVGAVIQSEFFDLLCKWNTQQPDRWAYAPLGEEG